MNNDLEFSFTKKIDGKFNDIINRISFALTEEGFSIISKLDIKEKILERTGKEIEDYIILGACNPTLAYEVLAQSIEVGVFLPCNIILYKKFNETYVSIIKPSILNSIIKNEEFGKITLLTDEKMKRILVNI